MKPILVPRFTFNIQDALRFREQHYSINFGKIIDSINQQVLNLPQVSLSQIPLVSVAFPRKFNQYGVMRFSDLGIFGIWPNMVITFALDGQVNTTDTVKSVTSKMIRRHVKILTVEWEQRREDTATKFVSVAFDALESKNFGFRTIDIATMRHVYNVLGLVYKNIFRFRPLFFDNDPYNGRAIDQLETVAKTNLSELTKDTPYFDWPLNREFYNSFPNMIPQSFLTHFTVHYYLKNVHPYVREHILKNTRTFEDTSQKVLGLKFANNSMLQILVESVLLNKQPYTFDESSAFINGKRAGAYLLNINADSQEEALDKILIKMWRNMK